MRHTLIECRAFANRGREDLLGLRPELPNGISRSRQEKREYGRRGSASFAKAMEVVGDPALQTSTSLVV